MSAQSATDTIHGREVEIYHPSPESVPSGTNSPEYPVSSGQSAADTIHDRKIAISRPGSPLTPRQQAVLPVVPNHILQPLQSRESVDPSGCME